MILDPDYARAYRRLYERHWWWRARERFLLDLLERRRPSHGWGNILDVGCGDGLFFDELLKLGEVEGVEPDERLVGDRHRDRIHVQPFDDRFTPGKLYSLILMLDVLEHLPEPAAALARARELLERGGTVLITVPAFNSAWTHHDEINRHYTRYTRRSFQRLADRAGLRVQQQRYFFHWIYPAKLFRRAAETALPLQPGTPRLPPDWLNQCLYTLCRVEAFTLGRLPLPFGSSLLVVGTAKSSA
jgi:SAM-dependent methyltransferase